MANYIQKYRYYNNLFIDFKNDCQLSTFYTIEGYNVYKHKWIDPDLTYEYNTEIPTIDKYFAIPLVDDTEQEELYSTILENSELSIGEKINVTSLIKSVYWVDDSYDESLPSINKLKIGQQTYNLKDTKMRNMFSQLIGGDIESADISVNANKVKFDSNNNSFTGESVDDALEQIFNTLYYTQPQSPNVSLKVSNQNSIQSNYYVGETIGTQTWTYSGSVSIPKINQDKGLKIAKVTSSGLTLTDSEKAILLNGDGSTVNFEYTQVIPSITISSVTNNGTFGTSVSLSATTEQEINPTNNQLVPSGSNATKTSTISALSYKAYYPYYYGVSDTLDIASVEPFESTKNYDSNSSNKVSYTTNSIGQYLVYITTKTVKSIKDINSFENISDFTLLKTIDNFNIYVTNNVKVCNNFSYTFTY